MKTRVMLVLALWAVAAWAKGGQSAPDAGVPAASWLGEALPLQLVVHSPEDLAFKGAAEKEYLVFNLLAGGKLAFDRGDYEAAVVKWETLLRTPGVSAEVQGVVKPYLAAAQGRLGQVVDAGVTTLVPGVVLMPLEPEAPEPAAARPQRMTVAGVVTGGGTHGPGGAVVVLRRTDGPMPPVKAARVRAVVQKDKRFSPHVLAVPIGATVEFRNDDEVFHNVFSLSKPNDFDLGLYKNGLSKEQTFRTAGPVHLLCNIHSSMNGWVYVVDSPYFAQADGAGKFAIKNVPDGLYRVEVWHEWSSKLASRDVKVAAGMPELSLVVDGDKQAPAFVPDKSGKPRQPQLGY